MPDEPGKELFGGEAGEDMLRGSFVLVLEGHVFPVVVFDPALRHGRALGIPSDVVRREAGAGQAQPHMYVPLQLPQSVPPGNERADLYPIRGTATRSFLPRSMLSCVYTAASLHGISTDP